MEFDKDLKARQEARALARRAQQAGLQLRRFSQGQIDAIVEAVAGAFYDAAPELAEMAVRETGLAMPRIRQPRTASHPEGLPMR